jgi:hypothetical protein
MAGQGGLAGVVKPRIPAEGGDYPDPGDKVRADHHVRARNQVLGHGLVYRALDQMVADPCQLRRLAGHCFPNSAGHPVLQEARPFVRDRAAAQGFRRAPPPREHRPAGMSGRSRQDAGAGAPRHHPVVPAPADLAREGHAHDRANRLRDPFRAEYPLIEDPDCALYQA